jgi:uncharacterized protein (DUF58 family)
MEVGLPVGLVAWSGEWISVPPGRGKRHRLDLLTHLAKLPRNDQHNHAALIDRARPLSQSDTTAVLVTSENVSLTRSPGMRGGMIALASSGQQGNRYFTFPDHIDFATGYEP